MPYKWEGWAWFFDNEPWGVGETAEEAKSQAAQSAQNISGESLGAKEPVIKRGSAIHIVLEANTKLELDNARQFFNYASRLASPQEMFEDN